MRKIRTRECGKGVKGASVVASLVVLVMFLPGCGANEGVLRSGKETPVEANSVNQKTAFEKDWHGHLGKLLLIIIEI